MLKTPQSKTELAIVPAIAGMLDGSATLLGQQAEYFEGQANPEELNPIGYFLLSMSPQLFGWTLVAWVTALTVVISLANDRMAVWVSLVIAGMHVFGVATWLVRLPFGLIWVVLLGSVFRFGVYPRYKLPANN